jgi:hypothetical protein
MQNRFVIGLTLVNLTLFVYQFASKPVVAQSVPDVVRARALELVDDRGRSRASIDVVPEGDVVLRLRDESGTIRVKMSANRSGSGLLLLDASTEPGVQLDAAEAGSRIRLTNRDGRNREIAP